MTFADHFSTIAARYAQHRPTYPPALVGALADRAPRGAAWDVGCGTGQLSVPLASRFTRVFATDPAQAQLDQATPDPRVEYRCAAAEASGLPAASVVMAVAAQAAHWFDWLRFVAEVERVVQPGGLAALVSYGILEVEGVENVAVARFYHDVVGTYWPPERRHVENGYRDLVWPWPAVQAPALAMTATWSRDELLGYIGTWSATVKLVAREGTAPIAALNDELSASWPDGESRSIRWPLTIKLARR
ncbi:MAG: class I SAM-dependent methyltransferase [Kofleriaceae bacterium]|nr:class I SAM-dependent methyltransferase [Kofleriaceae bacterium]